MALWECEKFSGPPDNHFAGHSLDRSLGWHTLVRRHEQEQNISRAGSRVKASTTCRQRHHEQYGRKCAVYDRRLAIPYLSVRAGEWWQQSASGRTRLEQDRVCAIAMGSTQFAQRSLALISTAASTSPFLGQFLPPFLTMSFTKSDGSRAQLSALERAHSKLSAPTVTELDAASSIVSKTRSGWHSVRYVCLSLAVM